MVIAAAGAAADLLLVAREHGKRAAADGADAEQTDVDRFHGRSAGAMRDGDKR